GTATVYLAWDAQERSWCALKVLQFRHLQDPETRRRFTQEAEALERLEHPNIPRLIAHDPAATPPYMAIELARCGSAMDWVREHGPMTPAVAAHVVIQVCEALIVVHDSGIVHRDVKPHNFLLDEHAVCKLTDFGIARVTDHTSLTATGSQIGTFSYMAPEQRTDTKSVDHRADIYSVGASLFTLLTGRTSAELFVADRDDELLAELPAEFREIVLRATRYKADDRYPSIGELQRDLGSALARLRPGSADYAPLLGEVAPLPAGPPRLLPPGLRFPDLERSMALDGANPTFVPADDRAIELLLGPSPKKVMPYFMPERDRTPPTDHQSPSYLDPASRTPAGPRSAPRPVAVEIGVEPARDDGAPSEAAPTASTEPGPERARLPWLGIAATGMYGLLALAVLTTLAGAVQVSRSVKGAVHAAHDLTEALRTESSVVYDVGGDRSEFERIYQEYLDAPDTRVRLDRALAFVDTLDRAVAEGQVSSGSQAQVRRLQDARDGFVDARDAWSEAATGFPGNLAVLAGLAPAP
ncbi:MAG: protein kinase, partial [Myxococcota bacterium]